MFFSARPDRTKPADHSQATILLLPSVQMLALILRLLDQLSATHGLAGAYQDIVLYLLLCFGGGSWQVDNGV